MQTITKHFDMLGSVSTATLRPEDLVPAFLDCLEFLDKPTHDKVTKEYADVLDCDDADSDEHQEHLGYLLEELFDSLQECAPPNCYFGAHEGDGADFGFWSV